MLLPKKAFLRKVLVIFFNLIDILLFKCFTILHIDIYQHIQHISYTTNESRIQTTIKPHYFTNNIITFNPFISRSKLIQLKE